ncbi:MAG: DNA adenine methylase [Anaerolineales bacterium]
MHTTKSPLRYPGGKNRAVKAILRLIPERESRLCSPFLGGGSIELACTRRMKVLGSDVFEPLVTFWQVLLEAPQRLADKVAAYYPLSRGDFYKLQEQHTEIKDPLEMAAAFFVLNRASYSGTTLSGGLSPGHPRFNLSSIERLRSFQVTSFKVKRADFREVIPKQDKAFLYLDPPYMNVQALYGVKGGAHKGFDHKALADLLYKRDRWIMSYNDSPEIRSLYRNYRIVNVSWTYGMNKSKRSNEVLILSNDIPISPS